MTRATRRISASAQCASSTRAQSRRRHERAPTRAVPRRLPRGARRRDRRLVGRGADSRGRALARRHARGHAGRAFARFPTGLVIGVLAAVLVRRAPVIEGLLDFARSVPPVVILPVYLLAFGYNELARLATVAFGCG